ncbi:MAG TPA: exosome complex RNA-binding protein Csl4 [Thermoplasmata archaeon]|nr:exosome complex RNA-binding protein Csl4 [Thermoplasmata archaeon]
MTDRQLPELVLPGDYLGAAEEFLPGRGTYEHAGRIYASLLGRPAVDASDRTIRVEPRNSVPEVREGELVYARVDELKTAMAICTVLSTAASRRGVPGAPEGTVHISKAKDGYTESLAGEFAVGDIILARVLQERPSIKLSTAAAPLGVVSARCQVCHALLNLRAKSPVCPRCGHQEHRKLAKGTHPFAPDAHAPRAG